VRILKELYTISLEEYRHCSNRAKSIENKKDKAKLNTLAYFNGLFLLIYSLVILINITYIILSFFYGLYILLTLLSFIPLLGMLILIRKIVYPKFKGKFLE
jgi:predicted nucleic acid-binding Zn ribbon protein